jgi:hypothetical protein
MIVRKYGQPEASLRNGFYHDTMDAYKKIGSWK